MGAASVPFKPNRMLLALILLASNPSSLNIATLMFLVLFGFILLASLLGLISIATSFVIDSTMTSHFRVSFRRQPHHFAPARSDGDDRICSFRYKATLGNDNPVRLSGMILHISAGGIVAVARARIV
jgi:hypothetical protein